MDDQDRVVSIFGGKVDSQKYLDEDSILFENKEALKAYITEAIDGLEETEVKSIDCVVFATKDINGSIKNRSIYISPLSTSGVLDVLRNRVLFHD